MSSENNYKSSFLEEDSIIKFNSFQDLDGLFIKIDTNSGTIMSETVGYWKDKPVVKFNNDKYVILEKTKEIIKIENLGIVEENISGHIINIKGKEEEITNNFVSSIKEILNKNIERVKENYKIVEEQIQVKLLEEKIRAKIIEEQNEKTLIVEKAPETSTISYIPLKKEEPPQVITEQILTNTEILEPVKPAETKKKSTSMYIENLRSSEDNSEQIEKTEEPINDKNFGSMLEKHRDDPQVKSFFNYHADIAKKELFAITEKFTKQQMGRAMESGGGTNAVQYANGGTMHGDLIIDGNITVTGNAALKGIDLTVSNGDSPAISALSSVIASLSSNIYGYTNNLSSNIYTYTRAFSGNIYTYTNTFSSNIYTYVNNISSSTNNRITDVSNAVNSLCQYVLVDLLSTNVVSSLTALSSQIYSSLNTVSSNATNLISSISSTVNNLSGAVDALTNKINTLSSNTKMSINYVMDGGSSINGTGFEIAVGGKGIIQIPTDFVVKEWTIVSDVHTSRFVVDVKIGNYNSLPTLSSVTNNNYISIINGNKNHNTSVTNWNNISAGDFLEFQVLTAGSSHFVNVCLRGDLQR